MKIIVNTVFGSYIWINFSNFRQNSDAVGISMKYLWGFFRFSCLTTYRTRLENAEKRDKKLNFKRLPILIGKKYIYLRTIYIVVTFV